MIRMKVVTCIAFFIMMIVPRIIYCVVMPDRGIIPNPLSRSIEGEGIQFLPLIGGWAELDKYWGITGDSEHCFDSRLGAAAEAFRIGNDYDLILSTDVELVANPDSPILFNPRSFFWQEALQLGTAMDSSFLHLGYVHRCKHDVDNLQVQDSTGERRIMVPIYDSFFARWISRPLALTASGDSSLTTVVYGRADIFVLTEDERSTPLPDKNINNLRYGLSAGLNSTMFRIGSVMVYSRFQYSIYAFSSGYNPAGAGYRELSADYTAEAGIRFPGTGGELSLFMSFEKQDMTMINPQNESSYFVFFGVNVKDTDTYD